MRDSYHPSVYGVGYLGNGKYNSKKDYKIYTDWKNILERSYSEKLHIRKPTYIGCSVVEEWHNFQYFAKWHEESYKSYMNNSWNLDKDILLKSNKIYSPKTCCFVPSEINSLFTNRKNIRKELPIGVTKSGNKFRARVRLDNAQTDLGYFDTVEEAFQAYKIAKEVYVKKVADKWKDQITEPTYYAMYNYQIEITD